MLPCPLFLCHCRLLVPDAGLQMGVLLGYHAAKATCMVSFSLEVEGGIRGVGGLLQELGVVFLWECRSGWDTADMAW